MQLATGYMNLALPSSFARMAVNIRFFQRQGVPPAAAVTSGAIDSFAGTIVQALLLIMLLLFSSADLALDERADRGHQAARLHPASAWLIVCVLVVDAASAALRQPDHVAGASAGGPR